MIKYHGSSKQYFFACAFMGVLVGFVLAGVAFILGAGGHGTRWGVILCFPYSELLERVDITLAETWIMDAICFIQMATYGIIVGFVRKTMLIGVSLLESW